MKREDINRFGNCSNRGMEKTSSITCVTEKVITFAESSCSLNLDVVKSKSGLAEARVSCSALSVAHT